MFLGSLDHKFLHTNNGSRRHIMYCMKLHNFHRTMQYNLRSILNRNCHYNFLSIPNRNCHCNCPSIPNRNFRYNCPNNLCSNPLYMYPCSCCHSLLCKLLNKYQCNLCKLLSNCHRMLRYMWQSTLNIRLIRMSRSK